MSIILSLISSIEIYDSSANIYWEVSVDKFKVLPNLFIGDFTVFEEIMKNKKFAKIINFIELLNC